jgi:hypothetical protein
MVCRWGTPSADAVGIHLPDGQVIGNADNVNLHLDTHT